MRDLKALTLITGLMISSMGFGMEGGGGGSKDSSETQTSRRYEQSLTNKKSLTRVIGQRLNFYCPKAKNLLAKLVFGTGSVQAAQEEVARANSNKIHLKIKAVGSGIALIPGLDVDPNDTIAVLKQRIAEEQKLPVTKVVSLFLRQDLNQELTDNTQTLTEAGIQSFSTLVLAIKDYIKVQKVVMATLYKISQKPEVSGFDLERPINEWPGVRGVDEHGRITWLSLSFNQLTGAIPSEIGELTGLKHLDLSENNLTGSIPSEIGKLTALEYLNLCGNLLTGSIPSEIGELRRLIELWLSSNQLTGPIPSEIGKLTKLTFLHLSYNQLTGIQEFKVFMKEKVPGCYVVL